MATETPHFTEPRVGRGKQPTTALAGPYGHPFHPIFVTIPIGAWVVSFVFDVASRRADDAATFATGAYWLIGIGVLGAVAAAVFGLLDLLGIPRRTRAFRTGLIHMTLNLAVAAAFAISFLVRTGDDRYERATSVGLLVLSAVCLLALAASGWLGGKLAYSYGVRVADEQTQAEGFVSQR
jgi:uncharacterized membrane protein